MTRTLSPDLILSIRDTIRTCTSCSLHSRSRAPVPWSGDPSPTYAVLGEAPGRQEDEAGEPFVGATGYHARLWLKQAGIDPTSVSWFNTVSCYPRGTPSDEHIAACRPLMHAQLELIRPRVLITMGKVAFNAIRHPHRKPPLLQLHGRPLFHPVYHFWIWPTYHPSAYLHGKNAKYEKMIREDLAALVEWNFSGAMEVCYVRDCKGELYRYDPDGWGIGLCRRHSMIQGTLWPEDR